MGNNISADNLPRWFRSGQTKMQPGRIDAEAGVMYDVVMVGEGPAKGHGVDLDGDFIEAITAYDNKHYSKIGLKARFGHPSASSETMGTQLGVFKNFRVREGKGGKKEEIADLYVLESAEKSPTHPGMRSWLFSMAEERPDFIMSSIVFAPSGYYVKKDGKKMEARFFYDWDRGMVGWYYKDEKEWTKKEEADLVYVEFEEKKNAQHHYTDIVEDGAATDQLFSTQINGHLFAAQADAFLHEHPHLITFLQENPDAVSAWMQRAGYTVSTHKKSLCSTLKNGCLAPTILRQAPTTCKNCALPSLPPAKKLRD